MPKKGRLGGGSVSWTGSNLRSLREKQGLTQEAIAKRSGVSRGYLSLLENNRVLSCNIQVAQKIAQALHVDLDVLLSNSLDQVSLSDVDRITRRIERLPPRYRAVAVTGVLQQLDTYRAIIGRG